MSASEVLAYTYWLAAVAGGGPTARLRHPLMGVIISASVLYMYKLRRNDMLIGCRLRVVEKRQIYFRPLTALTMGKKLFSSNHSLPGHFSLGANPSSTLVSTGDKKSAARQIRLCTSTQQPQ